MITAEKITKCGCLNSLQLEKLLRVNYPKDLVVSSRFVGITNGGQFCYNIAFPDDGDESGIGFANVFVELSDQGNLVCDY